MPPHYPRTAAAAAVLPKHHGQLRLPLCRFDRSTTGAKGTRHAATIITIRGLCAWPSSAAVPAPRRQGRGDPALRLPMLRRGDRQVRRRSPMDRIGPARMTRTAMSARRGRAARQRHDTGRHTGRHRGRRPGALAGRHAGAIPAVKGRGAPAAGRSVHPHRSAMSRRPRGAVRRGSERRRGSGRERRTVSPPPLRIRLDRCLG